MKFHTNNFIEYHLQRDIKLLPVTVNSRLKFEIGIVHDLSCHPIEQETDSDRSAGSATDC